MSVNTFVQVIILQFLIYRRQLCEIDKHNKRAVYCRQDQTDIRGDFAVTFALIVQTCRHHDKPDRQDKTDKIAAHGKIDDQKYGEQEYCHCYDCRSCFSDSPV